MVWRRPVGVASTRRAVPASVYRRRRLVVAALLLSTLLAGSWMLGVLGGGPLTASGAPSPAVTRLDVQPISRSTYVVGPGDTLWSIARHLQPTGDVRPVVDALAATRHGRPLQVGERIVVELP
jgi:hypothetical protein